MENKLLIPTTRHELQMLRYAIQRPRIKPWVLLNSSRQGKWEWQTSSLNYLSDFSRLWDIGANLLPKQNSCDPCALINGPGILECWQPFVASICRTIQAFSSKLITIQSHQELCCLSGFWSKTFYTGNVQLNTCSDYKVSTCPNKACVTNVLTIIDHLSNVGNCSSTLALTFNPQAEDDHFESSRPRISLPRPGLEIQLSSTHPKTFTSIKQDEVVSRHAAYYLHDFCIVYKSRNFSVRTTRLRCE